MTTIWDYPQYSTDLGPDYIWTTAPNRTNNLGVVEFKGTPYTLSRRLSLTNKPGVWVRQ